MIHCVNEIIIWLVDHELVTYLKKWHYYSDTMFKKQFSESCLIAGELSVSITAIVTAR